MSHLLRGSAAVLLGLLLAACGGGSSSGGATSAAPGQRAARHYPGPALSVPQSKLKQSLHCTPFRHPDKDVVLLVHGTFTNGAEQFILFYTPLLVDRGFDVCAVTYPDRGLGDQQVSAEYVVHALRRIHEMTGRQVDMIGHSQGATMPRWAIKFWPAARAVVDDFVLIAGPNHGTSIAASASFAARLFNLPLLRDLPVGLLPAAVYQFDPGSKFVTVLNAGDETPGDIDYTTLYTVYDELVQPVNPVPTAALDWGKSNPHVSNILLQDVCPGHFSDHLTIGTTDPVAFQLALDAISNPGPADFKRAGGAKICSLLPFNLQTLVIQHQDIVQDFLKILKNDAQAGLPDPHLVKDEPELMPYAKKWYQQYKATHGPPG